MNFNKRKFWCNDPQQTMFSSQHLQSAVHPLNLQLQQQIPSSKDMPSIGLTLNTAGMILAVRLPEDDPLGYPAAALIKRSLLSLVHPEDQASSRVKFTTYRQDLTQREPWTFRLICQDSNILWVQALINSSAGLPNVQKAKPLIQQVANQCAIAIRQARLYQAAQAQVAELEKLNRLKDDFLSTVSYELRTPMSNMKMAIQMLALALNQDTAFLSELAKPQAERSKAARYLT